MYNKQNQSTEIFGIGACTDIGTRYDVNQDYFHIDRDRGIFLVADGIGGGPAGEVASRIAVNAAHEYFVRSINNRESVESEALLGEMIHKSHNAIKRAVAKEPTYRGMSTTIAIAWILPAKFQLWTAHIGDTRVYHLRDTSLKQLTSDHTVFNIVRQAGMLPDDPEDWPPRSKLSQSLGASDLIAPDITQCEIKKGDIVSICSDGICDVLNEGEIRNILMQTMHHPQSICEELIRKALKKGASDNLTAIVVYFIDS